MRIVAADAFVGREPDDFLGVHENSKDVIGAERAAGAFKGEVLDRFAALKMESAPAIGADPNIVVRSARDGHHRTRRAVRFARLEQLGFVEETAVFGARLHADPQAPVRIRFQSIDKVAARLAENFFRLATFDREQAAALRAGVKFLADHRQAGKFQRPGMIFVGAWQRLIGNRTNGESDDLLSLGIGQRQG